MSNSKGPKPPTSDDYAAGRHAQWECAAHEAAHSFHEEHGRTWTFDERADWIDDYLRATPWDIQNQVRTCEVCSNEIARALLENREPFQVNEIVAKQIQKLGGRVAWTPRWRHKKSKGF